ncbi:MAG: hypothetical protein FWD99_10060 [Oscillospiraceae bacterium]|nr:hypothetical protein [Oscillospiraceae bacterium]
MKHKKTIIIAIIIIALLISAVLFFQWTNRGYSLGINPDEIYRISWWSFRSSPPEVTDRDEIEAIVRHLNAWLLIERVPRVIGGETPDMIITLYGADGTQKWYLSVRETGTVRTEDGNWYHITGSWSPVSWFSERFG